MASIINAATSGGLISTGDTSGQLQLQTGGTTALTISSGQQLTLASGTKILNSSGNPILQQTGSVLQVVGATYSTQTDSSASVFTATGLTASITPIATTSKILIIFSLPLRNGSSSNVNIITTIYKNGSNLLGTYGAGILKADTSAVMAIQNTNYLDSPATTSSTTYAIYVNPNGVSTAQWCGGNSTASITLMEIAG